MASSEGTECTPAAASSPPPAPPKIRDDWYQTETHVSINILVKNLTQDDVNITYGPQMVTVDLKIPDKVTCLRYNLSHPIVPDQSSHRILSSKIEVKLKKADGVRWQKLESELEPHPSEDAKPQKEKNWDKVVVALSETEEDKPQGEAALNALFQQIYGQGSDDVRRAMNKSFVESGGTVLSTVWNDVKKATVEVKPPDGVEYRKWDS
ncbi:protein SGT1 homolog [Thrips palmi]|uniref:Protein SGT1 homolog n=1 Tax=Thrips palmi TaxID=161013 RepID=A0A6P8Y6X3_THRPL|nr:protein SGT1 homolog [Thrips palmi]XP_034235392.1 protein SGT1 homolog [Thrips palmi]XP_034235393.1 protein SGT1 homolog [Thrips palmi]XP_034235394.1 protein SGT1 homolog [Thrips palmi]XP_034235395.1 protein SGT1 homolog [Thrips palmi]XP_034235396.1 protein SGT1 homolog [Thrips palmi]XP_034235397.1 protein SGT1 homolog [Thrips palmi]